MDDQSKMLYDILVDLKGVGADAAAAVQRHITWNVWDQEVKSESAFVKSCATRYLLGIALSFLRFRRHF